MLTTPLVSGIVVVQMATKGYFAYVLRDTNNWQLKLWRIKWKQGVIHDAYNAVVSALLTFDRPVAPSAQCFDWLCCEPMGKISNDVHVDQLFRKL